MKFSELKLDNDLVRIASELGFEEATFIQQKAIPVIKEGKDLFAQSETGSGKTAAFGFPIIEKIVHGPGIQCLVLTPTRELANQVASELHKFSKYRKLFVAAVYGGVSINPQIDKIRRADILVATPGRLLDHIQRGTVDLGKVKFLVMDEADKMFEMGFIDDVKEIIQRIPKSRQTLLFSATISAAIRDLAREHMRHPENIRAGSHVDKKFLKQVFYEVPTREKFSLLLHLIKKEAPKLGMVFCATREKTDAVARNLQKNGIEAVAIHGGHSQNKRNDIMKSFHAAQIHILVATDVAARGLDIKNVTHILNFDIPKTSQEYVHRIGRTARAGESGMAISLLCEQDHDNFRRVLEDRSLSIEKAILPDFLKVHFMLRSFSRNQNFRRGSFGNPELRERNYSTRQNIRQGWHNSVRPTQRFSSRQWADRQHRRVQERR